MATKKQIKNALFNINNTPYSQISNYMIVLVSAIIIKMFLILQTEGNVFITPFEDCVWVYIIFMISIRMMYSFGLLEGYWGLLSIPLFSYIILSGDYHWLISLSVLMAIIFRTFKLKEEIYKYTKK